MPTSLPNLTNLTKHERTIRSLARLWGPDNIGFYDFGAQQSLRTADSNTWSPAGNDIDGQTTNNYTQQIAYWDEFVSGSYSGWTVVKTDIGRDHTDAYDMWSYTFTPDQYDRTVLIQAGDNGDEVVGIYAAMMFFKTLLSYSGYNAGMAAAQRTRYVVIPVGNPYGYVNTIYGNGNGAAPGVAICHNWSWNQDGTYQDWEDFNGGAKGDAPFSEQETQNIKAVVDALLAEGDFTACLNFHDFGTGSADDADYIIFWPHNALQSDFAPMFRVVNFLRLLNLDRTPEPTVASNDGTLTVGTAVPYLPNYTQNLGVSSILIEFGDGENSARGDWLSAQWMTDAVNWYGNTILAYSQIAPASHRPTYNHLPDTSIRRLIVGKICPPDGREHPAKASEAVYGNLSVGATSSFHDLPPEAGGLNVEAGILVGVNVGQGGGKVQVVSDATAEAITGGFKCVAEASTNGTECIVVGCDKTNLCSYVQALKQGTSYAGNLALQPVAGKVGIGIRAPAKKLDVRDGTGAAQVRLSYSDTYYADLAVDSAGNFSIGNITMFGLGLPYVEETMGNVPFVRYIGTARSATAETLLRLERKGASGMAPATVDFDVSGAASGGAPKTRVDLKVKVANNWAGTADTIVQSWLYDGSVVFTGIGGSPSDPTPVAGRLYYNSSVNKFVYYNGTAWKVLAQE